MILVDAGPLVGLVDADDQHHIACARALPSVDEPLATVWPAITETMNLLRDQPSGQDAAWEMVERGAVRILPLSPSNEQPKLYLTVPGVRRRDHRGGVPRRERPLLPPTPPARAVVVGAAGAFPRLCSRHHLGNAR